MGMFVPADGRLSKNQMMQILKGSESICLQHLTTPEQMVYNTYKQTVWCPVCGRAPQSINNNNNEEQTSE